jgi:hypothetical protein
MKSTLKFLIITIILLLGINSAFSQRKTPDPTEIDAFNTQKFTKFALTYFPILFSVNNIPSVDLQTLERTAFNYPEYFLEFMLLSPKDGRVSSSSYGVQNEIWKFQREIKRNWIKYSVIFENPTVREILLNNLLGTNSTRVRQAIKIVDIFRLGEASIQNALLKIAGEGYEKFGKMNFGWEIRNEAFKVLERTAINENYTLEKYAVNRNLSFYMKLFRYLEDLSRKHRKHEKTDPYRENEILQTQILRPMLSNLGKFQRVLITSPKKDLLKFKSEFMDALQFTKSAHLKYSMAVLFKIHNRFLYYAFITLEELLSDKKNESRLDLKVVALDLLSLDNSNEKALKYLEGILGSSIRRDAVLARIVLEYNPGNQVAEEHLEKFITDADELKKIKTTVCRGFILKFLN